jgi:xanthine dehydrogenase accessory factor
MLPPPLIHVFGDSPVARALTQIATAAGYEMAEGTSAGATPATGRPIAGAAAVVVASHGRDEQDVLRAAVDAAVPYIALVASRRRGDAVLEELGLDRERIHTPAGLDIGARTAAEVAISILAEIISTKPRIAKAPIATAIDPLCGMQVAITPSALRSGEHYFCGPGCLTAFIGT